MATLGLAEGWTPAFSRAVYHATFAEGQQISDPTVLAGILDESAAGRLNRLAMMVQPAHLETREDRPLDPEEADWIRAETVRKELAEF